MIGTFCWKMTSLVPRPNFSHTQRTDGRDRLSVHYVNVSGKFGRGTRLETDILNKHVS